jgi:hypothetical protein
VWEPHDPQGHVTEQATKRGGGGSEALRERISVEAVREATGRDWDEWLAILDAAGAADRTHRRIVGVIERDHPAVPGW